MNDSLRNQLRQYRISEPGQENNELHSILGTEIRKLTPALETHYAQFFINRLAVVAQSEAWESVFSDLKAKIQRTEKQIRDLRARDGRRPASQQHHGLQHQGPARKRPGEGVQRRQVAQYNRLSRGAAGTGATGRRAVASESTRAR